MTDGGSKLKFLNAIEEAKCKTLALFVIFNYGIINENFLHNKKKVNLISLTNWGAVLSVAKSKKIISGKDLIMISNFLGSIGVKN